ncbi:cache domain-containing protein [Salidesulfovibrio onnuriiensis]|uniref:cache domain-containing protein n=1 Tax=Salidesulfovibrio onnuriiensis TaxID=2583823 RepID=UPI0011C9E3E7|nr:adenylate/guanylate cyclase domain-containing protein [Salidesulfovibrio onnuriiensis]
MKAKRHGTIFIPLYINIMTIFFLLIIGATGTVIAYNYHMNSKTALLAADQLLSQVADSVMERTEAVFQPAFMTVDTYSWSMDVEEKATLLTHPLAPMFFRTLNQNPNFTSLYMGFADGDYFLVSSLKGRDSARQAMDAPAESMWYTLAIHHRADGSRYALRKFLNADYALIDSRLENDTGYDPRKRPWYTGAVRTEKPVLSDIYIYSFSKEPGISVSQRFDGDVEGVFALDISLSNISKFLARQRISPESRIMIFGADGQLFAHPEAGRMVKVSKEGETQTMDLADIEDLDDPILDRVYSAFAEAGKTSFPRKMVKVQGVKYLVHVADMPREYGKISYLGLAVPMAEFTGPIARAGKQSIQLSLLVLAAFSPLVAWASRRITKPLNQIMDEVAHIRQFHLENPVRIGTRITEIHKLGRAMETMRVALKSFGRYIPNALVKNIITKNLKPELGGDRQELTLFFSDIADFTTLSESLSPEELTGSVTEYFDRVGSVILAAGGTIDKYIGDAVMSFWNAPQSQPDHAAQACLAALMCREAVHAFNDQRQRQGLPVMNTRFGLHTGDAVVGNIGSSDRMNYTAMGASVNLASRIEGLNKHYGTEILASQDTVKRAGGAFLFRPVGRAVPKGATRSIGVFELVGTTPEAGENAERFLVDGSAAAFLKQWKKAYDLYLSRQFDEAAALFERLAGERPREQLAAMYLESARAFAAEPPPRDWQGVKVFKTK